MVKYTCYYVYIKKDLHCDYDLRIGKAIWKAFENALGFEMNKNKVILIIICIVLLLMGLLLYLLFNQDAYISKTIYEVVPIPTIAGKSLAISIFRSFGADLLWSIALVLAIQVALGLKKKQIWLLMLCSLLGVAYELMQFLGIANGTADILDVLIYIAGSFIGVSIIIGGKYYEKA